MPTVPPPWIVRRLVLIVVVLLGCAHHEIPQLAPTEHAHYDAAGADPFAGIEVGMPMSAVGRSPA